MSKKKDILSEAIADVRSIKAAAQRNAEAVILESLKPRVESFINEQLEDMDAMEEASSCDDEEKETMDEQLEETSELGDELADLDLGDVDEEDEDSDSDEDSVDEGYGLTTEDLERALAEALTLQEVDHGPMGDVDEIETSKDNNPTGIMDKDAKEAGWETKKAPAAKDMTVKENRALKAKVATLVKENTVLRKANQNLQRTIKEVNLFNSKVLYATKILQNESLSRGQKEDLVKRMDSVKTVSEAKSLFESVSFALRLMSENKGKAPKSRLAEALGSKNVPSSQKVISESRQNGNSTPVANRWVTLAGLGKSDE